MRKEIVIALSSLMVGALASWACLSMLGNAENVENNVVYYSPDDYGVPTGERIDIESEFPVGESGVVLNRDHQLFGGNYKVNYPDTHYPLVVPVVDTVLFLPSGAPEDVYMELIAKDQKIEGIIDGVFAEVTDLVIDEAAKRIQFNADGVDIAGYFDHAEIDGESWVLMALTEDSEPNATTLQWVSAMKDSLGMFYSKEYARPVSIDGDAVTGKMIISNLGLTLLAPTTGVDSIDMFDNYATWEYSSEQYEGLFLGTTSTRDSYGLQEAVTNTKLDIEDAYTELFGDAKYEIEDRVVAEWCSENAMYMTGRIDGKPIYSYVFYNSAKNTYSTISYIGESLDSVKLLTALSERILFY